MFVILHDVSQPCSCAVSTDWQVSLSYQGSSPFIFLFIANFTEPRPSNSLRSRAFSFRRQKARDPNGDITDPRGKRRMSTAGDDAIFRIRPPFSVSIWESTDLYAVDLQQLFGDFGAKP